MIKPSDVGAGVCSDSGDAVSTDAGTEPGSGVLTGAVGGAEEGTADGAGVASSTRRNICCAVARGTAVDAYICKGAFVMIASLDESFSILWSVQRIDITISRLMQNSLMIFVFISSISIAYASSYVDFFHVLLKKYGKKVYTVSNNGRLPMTMYEIAVTLCAKDYFYTEKKAKTHAASEHYSFEEALCAFCEAIAFGYSVDTEELKTHLSRYGKKPDEVDKSYRLMLIRHDGDADTVLFENTRSDSDYEGEDTVVSCYALHEEELGILARHGIEPEEDSFGSYFEVYPLNDLLYDLSDACDGALDPMNDELRLLVKEYAHRKGLLTNEIDPSEEGYFCPGSHTEADCFGNWGKIYGYADDEQDIFTGSLVKYEHGFVMELRE